MAPITRATKTARMVMTAECPSVIAWMIMLPVIGSRPRGPPGADAPASAAVAVAADGSASCWSVMAARLLHCGLRSARCAGAGGPVYSTAGHQQAELLLGDGRRAERDDPALVHDGDAVSQGVDLVQ